MKLKFLPFVLPLLICILAVGMPGLKAQTITTFAGNGTGGFSGDGSAATSAELSGPYNTAVDASGNVYIADQMNNRVRKVSTSGVISTIAGNGSAGFSGDGGSAISASLNSPTGVAVDGSGNVYIADENNHRIRVVNTSGVINTFAGNGTAGFNYDGIAATASELFYPWGVAVDGSGNVYIADKNNERIRKVNTSGVISTIAGNGSAGFSGDGGLATAAELNVPVGVACDGSGNIYIVDENNQRIRKINTSGYINTVAGNGSFGFTGDGGQATAAEIYDPYGVAVDGSGNIYIADLDNERVRIVNTSGVINTYAGDGVRGATGDGGPATAAQLYNPAGVAVDGYGDLFISDYINNKIREIATPVLPITGTVSVCVGATATLSDATSGGTWSSSNTSVATVGSTGIVTGAGSGSATISYTVSGGSYTTTMVTVFTTPATITGTMNVCAGATTTLGETVSGGAWSSGNTSIATVGSTGIVSGVAGGTVSISYTIGTCTASASVTVNPLPTVAAITGGTNICTGSSTSLSDVTTGGVWSSNNTSVATVGSGTGDVSSVAAGNCTISYAVSNSCGTTTVTTNVTVSSFGGPAIITTIAGNGTGGYGAGTGDGGAATATDLHNPFCVAIDASGNIYIADQSNNRIRKVSASGIISTVAGNGAAGYGAGSGDGGAATATDLYNPTGVAVDGSGNIYIADHSNNRIRKVSASGIISTVAGNGAAGYGSGSGDGGAATATDLSSPNGVAVDGSGNIYIADEYNQRIRKVSTSGIISTVAGNGAGGYGYGSGDGGAATATDLSSPFGVAVDGSGNIYIADYGNNRIRIVSTSGIISTAAGNGAAGYGAGSGDGGAATATDLYNPAGVAVDGSGNIYIADANNNRIRKVSTSGIISTVAGNGVGGYGYGSGDGGAATATDLWNPAGVAIDGSGNIYIAEYDNQRIRKVSTTSLPAITGTATVCAGATTTLSDVTIGGTWSSSNSNATVGSTTGVVTGVTGGTTATITYTFTNSCGTATTSTTVSINASPASITGTLNVCISSTTNLSDGSSGGTWSSANTAVGTVGSTGTVMGITSGTDTIKYTLAGCSANAVVTVNAAPTAAPTNSGAICSGSTVTLSANGSSGVTTYTWSGPNLSSTTVANPTATPTVTTTYSLTVGGSSCSSGTVYTTTVTVNSSPGSITGTTSLCQGYTTTLNCTPSGGTWSSYNPSVATITSTGAVTGYAVGTSIITYTVSGGCGSGYVTTVVTVNPAPAGITIPSPGDVCPGGTITLSDGTSGGTWSTSGGLVTIVGSTGTVTGVSAGNAGITYTITATGCSISTTLSVISGPTITASSGVTICNGSSTTLTASGGVAYTWSPSTGLSSTAGASVTASPTVTTTYTVTGVSSGGCSGTATVTVSINPTTVGISGTTTVCSGSTTSLTGTPLTGGTWSSSNTAVGTVGTAGAVYGVAAGTVTISYTYGSCTATTMVTVNGTPTVSAGSNVGICTGSSTSLTATGATTYTWSPSVSLSASTGASVTANPTITTTYSVTGFSTAGCSNTATVTVSVSAMPTIVPSSGVTICSGTSTGISATGGVTYTWSPATGLASTTGAGVTASPTVTTTYTVTGTNASGCSNTATVMVSVNTSPTITAGSGSVICSGSSASLSASGGTTYTWSPSTGLTATTGTPVTATPTVTTTYMVTGTTSGCSNTASVTITVDPLPTSAAISGPSAVDIDQYITLYGSINGGTWTSLNTSVATIGASTGIVIGYIADTVTIKYTLTNSCGTGNSYKVITVNPVSCTTEYIYNFAGTGIIGSGGFSGDGGAAVSAQINGPYGLAADRTGNIYIADQLNNRIRMVNTSGVISTIAGNGSAGFGGDGSSALSATLNGPTGVAVDASGNVYIADMNNHRIRQINTSGIISTIAGNGTGGYNGDGVAATSELYNPWGVAVDGSGNVYVADMNNERIREINMSSGNISTVAGNGTAGFSGDGGAAISAMIHRPTGVSFDPNGNLYIVDETNQRIREVVSGVINTVAGNGTFGFAGDGGAAVSAELNDPYSVAIDGFGNMYIADVDNERIRIVNSSGVINTLAGNSTRGHTGDGGPAASAELYNPSAVTVDGSGNIYLSDNISNYVREIRYPVLSVITGDTIVCYPSTLTLSDATSGGTWSSGTTAIATIGSGSGVVTSVAKGITIISYSLTGCTSTDTIRVKTLGANLTNSSPACVGGTVDLFSTDTGNAVITGYTWSGPLSFTSTVANPVLSTSVTTSMAGAYTFTLTAIGTGCVRTASTTVTVNTLVASPSNNGPACIGGTITLSPGITGTATPLTYLWNGPLSYTSSLSSPVLTCTTSVMSGTYTFTVTAAGSGCIAYGATTLTVNPTPTVNPVSSQTVCNGTIDVGASFTGSGTSYTWVNDNTAIGLGSSGTGNISFTSTNGTSSPILGDITVTPVYTNVISCYGPTTAFTITVNPTPSVNPVSNQAVCNGATGVGASFAGTGTSYTWVNDNTAIGLGSSGTGNISFTATNSTSSPIIGDITVTPVYTNSISCTGSTTTFTITVNPTPSVNPVSSQTVCNGATGVGTTFSGTGTSYTWVNDNTAIGLGSSGTGNISFTATNATISPISGDITVTPVYTNSVSCSGSTTIFSITVNPTPTASISYTGSPYCATGTASVTQSGTSGGTYSSTSGLVINSSTGDVDLVASTAGSYTVTYSFTSGACSNTTTTGITITALPTAGISYTGSPYCATGTASVTQSGTSGGTYSSTSGLVINSSTGDVDLVASTAGSYTVTYSFTSGACSNTTTTGIIINPLPTYTSFAGTGNSVCIGMNGTVAVASDLAAGSYTITYNTGVASGYTATVTIGGGAGDFTVPGADLVSGSNTVTFVSIAYTSSTSCTTGLSGTATVTINPEPALTSFAGAGDAVCAGADGTVTVTTTGLANGSYTVWYNTGVTSGLSAALTIAGGGGTFTVPTADMTPTDNTITFNSIAYSTSPGCTTSLSGTAIVTDNPTPSITLTNTSNELCYDASSSHIESYAFTSPSGADNYSLTWSPTAVLTDVGAYSAISGSSISTTVPTAATAGDYSGTLTIETAATGCTTVYMITLTVDALPIITDLTSPYDFHVCASGTGTVTTITLNATPSGGTWAKDGSADVTISADGAYDNEDVSGLSVGSSVITYTSGAPDACISTVNVTVDDCSGHSGTPYAPLVHPVYVYPNPTNSGSNVTISWENQVVGPATIKIINDIGQTIYTAPLDIYSSSGQTQLVLGNLVSGIYVVTIISDNMNYCTKLQIIN